MSRRILCHTRLIVAVLLLAMGLLVASPAAVVLAIADPDTPPQVTRVDVFNDVLEDGDAGILIDYYLDYAVIPSETATEAYMASFINTDGTTQLGTEAPYTYVDSGYGRGAIWIYFTAAEVTADSIDSADEALYSVWLMGNPTVPSGWTGDPPKTVAGVDAWWATGEGDPAVLLRSTVLTLANALELAWSLDMIEETSLGSRLTTLGVSYFTNVVPGLRDMAPACFSAGEQEAIYEDVDYTTSFGATMTDGTGTVTGSPITLVSGNNTVTVTVVGTFTLELNAGTVGTVTDGTGAVTGSPVDIVAGTNTITVPGGGAGTLIVAVALENTQTSIEDSIIGTGFDLTGIATEFGMTRSTFSVLVWLLITILLCAAAYKDGRNGKAVLVVFDVSIIGGTVLGFVPVVAAATLFILFGFMTGYVLFYRGANF